MTDMGAKRAEMGAPTFEKLVQNSVKNLDKPLNTENKVVIDELKSGLKEQDVKALDAPLNAENQKNDSVSKNVSDIGEKNEVKNPERMEPQIVIPFKCPEGMDRKEFTRQLKGQERGLNSQTLATNMDNRENFEQRKAETGNGRDVGEAKKQQEITREKALHNRINTNQEKGMSYSEAKQEAEEWIKGQAALHNPDQIAGGDPTKVSRMGDAKVNSSIGSQWRTRVEQLADGVNEYAKGKTREELENTKMNVKLVVV